MLRQSLINLWMTLHTAFLSIYLKTPGWRYPLVTYTGSGNHFPQNGTTVERIGFNIIKHHALSHLLSKLPGDYVIVAAVHDDHLRLNVHRIVMDENQSDLCIPTNGQPYVDGTCQYLLKEGELYHALNATSWSRQRGFFPSEPVMSYKLPLSVRQQIELEELYSNETYCFGDGMDVIFKPVPETIDNVLIAKPN